MHVMGAIRRVLSSAGSRLALRVLVRVATVIGWVVLVNHQDHDGPAPDDGTGYVAYVLLMCVVALWAVIDGIRRPFATALLAWSLTVLAMPVTFVVAGAILDGTGLRIDLLDLVFPAGIAVVVIGAPATAGAAVGSAVRLVASKPA